MRQFRGPDGSDRIWFKPSELEHIPVDELHKAGLLPEDGVPDPSIDIERFLERHLRVDLDRHADLPPDVLGVTRFAPDEPPRVEINRDLTGSALDGDDPLPGNVGRWRATLAHEAAHVLLHRMLFELDDMQRGLFREADRPSDERRLMRCLKRDVGFSRASDWREVQANQGMAALLMPRPLFVGAARRLLDQLPPADRGMDVGSARADELARALAALFRVSRQAARIRLGTLSILTAPGQGALGV